MSAARRHLALGLLVCVLIPGASWLDGSGRLAYTMFADLDEERVEIEAVDRAGRSGPVSPSWMASQLDGTVAVFLAGAERFRRGPVAREPRRHLGALGRWVCAHGQYRAVTVTLQSRPIGGGPVDATSETVTCPR